MFVCCLLYVLQSSFLQSKITFVFFFIIKKELKGSVYIPMLHTSSTSTRGDRKVRIKML